ncbi:MAG: outer membrane protein assembly factor BamE [Lautropia sp.]|nr:outer membrane protein assembly factor BamE [Lautropia sp.]
MPIPFSRSSTALLLTALLATLNAGCASDRSSSGFLKPYRFSIPQGNYVSQEMLDEVKEGMNRDQVRLMIGTPLLTDVFHPNRWDYVFRFQYPNGDSELRRVIVFFEDERVSEIRHDKLPQTDDPNDPALPGYQPSKESDA